ncbi:MAG: hypothetical protein LBI69_04685 [Puniceicoccales bacterium]|nr:hypothetical protein [Puniceicoccales bacterium]
MRFIFSIFVLCCVIFLRECLPVDGCGGENGKNATENYSTLDNMSKQNVETTPGSAWEEDFSANGQSSEEHILPEKDAEAHFFDESNPMGVDAEKFLSANYVNGIVAIVNDRVITAGELHQEMVPLMSRLGMWGESISDFRGKFENLLMEALDEIIARVLIVQEFYNSGMHLTKKQRDFQLDELIRSRFGGDRLNFLKQLHDYGKSLQQFKKEMEESFIVEWMASRLHQSRSEISPSQIRGYYETHLDDFLLPTALRIGQIYLPSTFEDGDTNAPIENSQIAEIMEKLNSGEAFDDVIALHGQNAIVSADTWIAVTDLKEELCGPLLQLREHSYSDPIVIGNQVGILFLHERREQRLKPVQEVQSQIENILTSRQLGDMRRQWIQKLREKSYIKIYLTPTHESAAHANGK